MSYVYNIHPKASAPMLNPFGIISQTKQQETPLYYTVLNTNTQRQPSHHKQTPNYTQNRQLRYEESVGVDALLSLSSVVVFPIAGPIQIPQKGFPKPFFPGNGNRGTTLHPLQNISSVSVPKTFFENRTLPPLPPICPSPRSGFRG